MTALERRQSGNRYVTGAAPRPVMAGACADLASNSRGQRYALTGLSPRLGVGLVASPNLLLRRCRSHTPPRDVSGDLCGRHCESDKWPCPQIAAKTIMRCTIYQTATGVSV